MKKFFAVMLGVCTLSVVCSCAWADVAINATNFPNEVFREYVRQFDGNGNGVLSDNELAAVEVIDVEDKDITSLQGVEYFTALRVLQCKHNRLSRLDVSNNVNLVSLDCSYNGRDGFVGITKLNFTGCTKLVYLNCSHNFLDSLDVKNYPALEYLGCSENSVGALDVSRNTSLKQLYCYACLLHDLDVSNNPALEVLWCGHNYLHELDVSKNVNLTALSCLDNLLRHLDVTANTQLKRVDCAYQVVRDPALIITSADNASYPYEIKLGDYVPDVSRIYDLDVTNNGEKIPFTFSGGVLSCVSFPSKVVYYYRITTFSGHDKYVEDARFQRMDIENRKIVFENQAILPGDDPAPDSPDIIPSPEPQPSPSDPDVTPEPSPNSPDIIPSPEPQPSPSKPDVTPEPSANSTSNSGGGGCTTGISIAGLVIVCAVILRKR